MKIENEYIPESMFLSALFPNSACTDGVLTVLSCLFGQYLTRDALLHFAAGAKKSL